MQAKQLCVLIPSLEPDERLPVYVDALLAADFGQIVIVNDGSSAQYDASFDSLAARERCVVLKHEVNRGKGQALRTGVAYIRDHTAFAGVITADADGQHTVHDTLLLADAMDEKKPELLLGSRDFSHKNKSIPFRSHQHGVRPAVRPLAARYTDRPARRQPRVLRRSAGHHGRSL